MSPPRITGRFRSPTVTEMGVTTAGEAIAAALVMISNTQPLCGATKVVAIDGPSGAGKTDFAAGLARRITNAYILHMDDLYPGWDGLQQGVDELHEHVLAPLVRGEQAAYRRWDWEHGRYAGWQILPSADLLVVEGAGSAARPGATGRQHRRRGRLLSRRDVHIRTVEGPTLARDGRDAR